MKKAIQLRIDRHVAIKKRLKREKREPRRMFPSSYYDGCIDTETLMITDLRSLLKFCNNGKTV
jgi:hypothetical protein